MNTSRKVLALLLSVLLVVAVFAGCNNSTSTSSAAGGTSSTGTPSQGGTESNGGGDTTKDPITYTLWFGEHASEPYHADTWVLAPWAKEKFNITLDISATPATDWETKRATAMAGGNSMPDILMGVDKAQTDDLGSKGMFLDLMKYKDNMPNMMKVMEDFPLYKSYLYEGTSLYAQPTTIATDGAVNMTAYYTAFWRQDIADELKLEAPKTFDDFTAALKKMKEAYPDKYPWSQRLSSNMRMITNFFAPGLGIEASPYAANGTEWSVWNADEKKFTSIMEEENFKWFIGWMADLYKDGIIDPSFATNDTAAWETKMTAGDSFFSVDYFSRPDMFNASGTSVNPKFALRSILTPALEGGTQQIWSNIGIGGFNGFKATIESPERLAELLDSWYYTEEGCLLMTYGIEGETYTKNDDKTLSKHFTDKIPTALDFDAAYGVNYLTFYAFKPDFFGYNLYDKGQSDAYNYGWDLYKDMQKELPPVIVKNGEEAEKATEYIVDLRAAFETVLDEFIMGKRDMSQWDAAKTELDQAGYARFLEELNATYQRMYA